MDIQFGKLKVGDKFLVRNSDSGDAEEAVRVKVEEIKWGKGRKAYKTNTSYMDDHEKPVLEYIADTDDVICVQPPKNNAGNILRHAPCAECGDSIPIAVILKSGKTICNRCLHPRRETCGNTVGGQETFGSWDNAVRVCEA